MVPKYVARSTSEEGARGSVLWVQCVLRGTLRLGFTISRQALVVRSQAKERGLYDASINDLS